MSKPEQDVDDFLKEGSDTSSMLSAGLEKLYKQFLDNQVIAAGDALKEKFLDHDEIDEDGLINFG